MTSSRRIRKAFLPGAGLGTRLRPLTNHLPKPLVPFYHEPLILRTLRLCREAGITDIMINTHHLPEKWEEAFPEHQWEGMKLHFSHEPVLLDSGGGMKKIENWIDGEDFLVCNADNLTSISLKKLTDAHCASDAHSTLALQSFGYKTNVGFDPATGKITDMRHHLGITPGTHQFTGIYCLSAHILDKLPQGEPVSIVPALWDQIEKGQVQGVLFDDDLWIDLGTPEVYLSSHQLVTGCKRHPDAQISPKAEVDDLSIIGASAVIPEGVRLKNCIVWPHVKLPPRGEYINQVLISGQL